MSKEDLIRQACRLALEAGVEIQRGPLFSWGPNGKLESCCAMGATLLEAGLVKQGTWVSTMRVMPLLEVDSFWVRRFLLGFDRNYRVMFLDDDFKVIGQDDVSFLGQKLAREFVK